MPVTHPTLTLGDQLVTVIGAAWNPASPDAVSRVFEVPVTEETAAELRGQQRWVIPLGYRDEPLTRGQSKWTHHFLILTVEKFPETQSGLPDLDWADERAEQVLALKEMLDFPKDGGLLKFGTPQRSVWTENFEEVEVYDPELLRDFGIFWSSIEVYYGEVL
ncbi:MAG: hypothetical protein U0791_23270 [Gemmataceae bacterium]